MNAFKMLLALAALKKPTELGYDELISILEFHIAPK